MLGGPNKPFLKLKLIICLVIFVPLINSSNKIYFRNIIYVTDSELGRQGLDSKKIKVGTIIVSKLAQKMASSKKL